MRVFGYLFILNCFVVIHGFSVSSLGASQAASRPDSDLAKQARDYLQTKGRNHLVAHVNTSRPMAYKDENGSWIGLEMGQIRAACEILGVDLTLQGLPDPNNRFAGLQDGSADIVFGGLSVTPERLESGLDFSQATVSADLCTVARWDKGAAMGEGLFSIVYATLDGKTLLMFLIVFPLAVKVVRSCRHHPQLPSIQLGFLLTCLIFLSAVFFLCVTQDRVKQVEVILDYYGDDDLAGRRVATKANTTSAKTAIKKKALLKSQHQTQSFAEAFALLQDKNSKVEFVVADFPVAAHYVNKGEGKGKAVIVGPRYNPQNYGVVFKQGNALIRSFDIALLKVQHSDMFDELMRAYLGDIYRVD